MTKAENDFLFNDSTASGLSEKFRPIKRSPEMITVHAARPTPNSFSAFIAVRVFRGGHEPACVRGNDKIIIPTHCFWHSLIGTGVLCINALI